MYKVTFFFNSGVQGWSESYYNNAANEAAAVFHARELAKKRIALCGEGVDLPRIRVSDVAIRGDSILDSDPGYSTDVNKAQYTFVKPATPAESSDVSWTAAVFTLYSENIAVGRIFARGLADDMFKNDRVFIPFAAWIVAFQAYAQEIRNPLSSWGVSRKAPSTPANTFPITSAVAPAGQLLALTVPAGFAAADGSAVTIRGLKSNLGTLSGPFTMISKAGGVATISKSFPNFTPVFEAGTGTIQSSIPGFVQDLVVKYSNLATSRRSGRPFGSLRGRRNVGLQLR